MKKAGLMAGTFKSPKFTDEGRARHNELKAAENDSDLAIADAQDLASDGMPFKASAVDKYGMAVPPGYERDGDVFKRAAKPAAQPITDLGEKIGGARKDLAESGGTRRAKQTEDDRPAWARRFNVSQIVRAPGQINGVRDEGRWVIRDSRSLDWMKQPKQVGGSTFATQEEAEAFIPIAAVGLKHRTVAASGGKYEIWRDINDRKRVKVVDQQFDTRDDAMRYMAQNAVAIVETNTTFGEADIPLPPNRSRTGPSRRTGDVDGNDFIKAFNLRGVEFGNWNNQDERQTLMNEAWDGLMDLADVLGVPPKALGLGGDLALAFGARGHGLHSARAHYERDRAVINLTKEKGAGTLAHEWLHAMDHYFGRQDGKASAEWVANKDGTRTLKVGGAENDMVSSGFRGTRSGVRPELREAFNKVMQTIAKKAEGYVADTVQADKFVGRARDEVAEAVKRLRADLAEQKDPKYYKRFNKPASAELLAEFDAISARAIEGEASVLSTDWRIVQDGKAKAAARWTNDTLERLSAIYKEVRGRGGFNAEKTGWMDRMRGLMTAYEQRLKMLADAQSGTEKQRLTPTEFAMNAKELDQGRNEDYWTTPHELAARAFQAYVEDKIAERGNVSRFLNYAPENAMLPTPWGFKRVYPAGQERQAINAAFDAFVKELKVKDEGGKTVLYSRRGSTSPATSQATPQTETQAFKRWFGDSKVVDEAGKPLVVYHGTDRMIGSFDGQAIYFTDSPEVASGYATASGATRNELDDLEQRIGELYNQIDDDEIGSTDAAEAEVAQLETQARRLRANMRAGQDAAIYPVFVRLLKPAVVNLGGRNRGAGTTSEIERMDSAIRRAKSQGHDGVIFEMANDAIYESSAHTVYVAFNPEQIKSAIGNNGSFDPASPDIRFNRKGSSAVNLPPAAIGGSLARVNNHPDYAEAKAGDAEASLRLARDLVTDGFIEEVRQLMGSQGGVLLPVIAQESAGRNKIPLAVAEVLAERMGVETDLEIAQATRTHRTDMDGLSRVLKSPEFYGTVKTGQRYLLVDDTLTQGGTFASLANHIRAGGGEVLGVAALSGKRYSAALSLSDEYLTQLRERFGDVEGAFRAATGYGFDGLTESEGRYLVKHDAPEQVRDRILAAGREAGFREDAGVDGPGSGDRRLSSESPRERFRRLLGVPARGIPLAQARQMARAYEDAGLRGVNVAATPADLPADLRRRLEGAADDVRGAYFPDRDQTWVFSDRVNDPDEFAFVVLHEAFHRGLGKTFGRDAKRLMGQMYQTNRRLRERADKVAAELGIDRDEAIEEALADMAGEGRAQKLRGWTKLSALIRTWLGKVLDAVGLRMTFSDAQIETFVSAMAREGLRNDARVTTGAGVDRLVAASKAARQEQTETQAFRRWFGDSKVVDEAGKPLVVYHGTVVRPDTEKVKGMGDITAFDRMFTTKFRAPSVDTVGSWFSTNPGDGGAEMYSGNYPGSAIYPVYLSIKNPQVTTFQLLQRRARLLANGKDDGRLLGTAEVDAYRTWLKEMGKDGIKIEGSGNDDSTEFDNQVAWIALEPEQVKSAIGNDGSFDPANPDIRFSRRASTSLPAQAAAQGINIQSLRNAVMDRFRDAGTKVSWWDKTLGTQFDKAKRIPAFGKVFDRVQQYLEDTSTLANEAADQAPSILPKLDSVRDVWDAAKRGLNAKDREAIKAPIFEGTLIWTRDENGKLIRQEEAEAKADKLTSDEKSRVLLRSGKLAPGVLKMWLGLPIDQYEQNIKTSYAKHMLEPGAVFTPDELRSLYKLTDAQIKQYQEFRAAVNTSLDQVVATDALRMLGDVAELPEELHRAAVGDREGFRAALDRILDARIDAGGDEADVNQLKQLRSDLVDKYAKVDALKARGYAPLMRFGTFKVVVPGKNGEDVDFFALYETKAEANAAARALNDLPEFRGRVEQGTLSEEAYKLFSQVPLESLEMFAEAIGAEQSEVFQEYLRMAKNNRSALKRLIQRKGIAGYNEDVSRVLASFVTSNARMAAGTVNLAQAKEAAQGIREGDVKDEAIRLIETVQNPTETAGALRGLMFVHFIGGSIASAIVNVTQPVMMTTPYLSQWGGMAKASARLLAAGRQVSSGKIADPDSAEALRRAEKDGIVSPQEIHHLTAEAMQTFGRNPVLKRAAFLWGAPFSLAEQFNRRITFLAAYQTAKAEGMADPFEFAEKAVIETQGLYNKGNASNWARNPIGAVALTFKQYSIHYLEWLRRMWNTGAPDSPERKAGRRAVWFALIMLALAGGVEGLPFMEDLNDIVDTFLQAAGIDTSAKGWKRDAIANTLGLGDEGADVVMRGFSAVGGFPLDVSIRMGMGNLLPGTGIWLRSNTDVSRDVLELAGPAGSLLGQVKDAGQKALSGDAAGAATALLPVALQNAAKGVQMLTTGEARDTKGRKIMEADEMDAAMKIIGFQPAEIARESSKIGMERKRVQLTRNVEMKIADLWAQGLRERDADMVQEARQELLEWNQANPQSRIQITNAQVLKRLKDMQATRAERFQRAAPKELRQGLAVQ